MKIRMSGSKDITKTFPCTYHGWVMIPVDLGNGRKLPYTDQNKMIKIGKKVATSQIVARRDGDKATVVINPTGVTVLSETPRAGAAAAAAPLLSAAMETISCMLLSKDTGIAVIMAFTWDHNGQRGVGCDVIRFGGKPKKAIKQFGNHFNKSMALQEKNLAFLGAQRLACRPAPAEPSAPNTHLARTGFETAAPIPLARSNREHADQALAAEAEDRFGPAPAPLTNQPFDDGEDGGYMTTVAVQRQGQRRRSSAFNEQPNGLYLDVDPSGNSGNSGGYLDCIQDSANEPAGDDHQYITVRARRSTGFSRSSYMSVEAASG